MCLFLGVGKPLSIHCSLVIAFCLSSFESYVLHCFLFCFLHLVIATPRNRLFNAEVWENIKGWKLFHINFTYNVEGVHSVFLAMVEIGKQNFYWKASFHFCHITP